MSEITVTISGLTGSGKSAIAGEIEVALKAIGVPVVWKDAEREHWHHGNEYWIDLYKPEVTLIEQNIPRQSAPSGDVATVARIIDPHSFKRWDGLYHHCIKNGDDEAFAKRCADSSHKPDCEKALAKARDIIALIQSAAHGGGTEGGEA